MQFKIHVRLVQSKLSYFQKCKAFLFLFEIFSEEFGLTMAISISMFWKTVLISFCFSNYFFHYFSRAYVLYVTCKFVFNFKL